MDKGWRPIAELRSGHYAVGMLPDGQEVDIFRAGNQILNVLTGTKIDGVMSWQPREFVTERPISPKLKEEGF